MTIAEAAQKWYARQARAWCANHAEQVKRFVKGWTESFGRSEVGAVTVADVEAHEMRRDDGKRSASALNQERGYLRALFKWCRLNKWRDDDPTQTWKFRKVVVRRKYAELSREEEDRLVAASPAWLGKFVRVAVLTGLREGAIRQLRWEMVKGDTLEVPSGIMKTREPHCLPIVARLREALGERGEGPIFPWLPGPANLYKAFKTAAWKARLPAEVSPHDLRRTFVARLTEGGVPLQTVMALGAWKTMSTLLAHYASRATKKAAVGAMELV